MEKKKKASEVLYKNSPKMERGEDGKMAIKKSKDAETPTEKPEVGQDAVPMEERHMKDLKAMHGRHAEEHADMVKRHMKEMKANMADSAEQGE